MIRVTDYKTAVAKGRKRYRSNLPCQLGHSSERYVSSRNCIECVYLRQAGKYKEVREMRKKQQADNVEMVNEILCLFFPQLAA